MLRSNGQCPSIAHNLVERIVLEEASLSGVSQARAGGRRMVYIVVWGHYLLVGFHLMEWRPNTGNGEAGTQHLIHDVVFVWILVILKKLCVANALSSIVVAE